MLGAVLRAFHVTSLLQLVRQVQFVFILQKKKKTDRDRLMIFLKVTKLLRVRARTQVHSQLDSLPVLRLLALWLGYLDSYVRSVD